MSRDDGEDKPKKSWREIDQGRDKSSQRRDDRSDGRASPRLQQSQAYRAYKTQLNKLFDGGALPEALKEKLQDAGVGKEGKERKTAAQAIIDAATPDAVESALAAYRQTHGFPVEDQVLAKLLDLSNDAVLMEAVQAIGTLQAEGKLKRGGHLLKAKLNTVSMTADDPGVQRAAKELLGRL